jgi:hypothetical protein
MKHFYTQLIMTMATAQIIRLSFGILNAAGMGTVQNFKKNMS